MWRSIDPRQRKNRSRPRTSANRATSCALCNRLSACYSFLRRKLQRPKQRRSSKMRSAAPVPQRCGGPGTRPPVLAGSSAKKQAKQVSASRGTCLRCAGPPPSMRGGSNAEKHRTTPKSGNSALKTAPANVHTFCMRAKRVAATSSDPPLTSPIVLGWPALVCNKRGFLISCNIVVVWPG